MSIIKLFQLKRKQNNSIKSEELLNIDNTYSKPDNQEEQEYEIVEKEILPEKMICPDCGGITLVGLDFCDKCGGELINNDI